MWETGFGVLSLLLFSGAVLPLVRSNQSINLVETGSDPMLQYAFAIAYGVMCLYAVRKVQRPTDLWLDFWPAWVLVIYTFGSVAWSDAPSVTVRRAAALFASTLFGHYLAARFRQEHVRLLAITLAVALGASLLFGLLSADAFAEFGGDGLRGVFLKKNALGRIAALSLVLFIVLGISAGVTKKIATAGLVLSLLTLSMSQSMSAMVTAGATTMLMVLMVAYRSHRISGVTVALLLVLSCAIGFLTAPISLEELAEAVGRDGTLTGRTPLWQASLETVYDRPWLGYGFGAFWLGLEGPSSDIWSAFVWHPPHSHNGFLDLLLELGVVGLVLYLAMFAESLRRALRVFQGTGLMSVWALTFLVFLVSSNLTESALLKQNNLFWVLYVATAASLHRRVPTTAAGWRIGASENANESRLAPVPAAAVDEAGRQRVRTSSRIRSNRAPHAVGEA